MGLESAETTLTNPGPRTSGGVCGDIEDAGGRGACMGLESDETTLTNPGPCASGGVCGDIEDAGGRACMGLESIKTTLVRGEASVAISNMRVVEEPVWDSSLPKRP